MAVGAILPPQFFERRRSDNTSVCYATAPGTAVLIEHPKTKRRSRGRAAGAIEIRLKRPVTTEG